MTTAGIEPATFRFVAEYLNHCATAVPQSVSSEMAKLKLLQYTGIRASSDFLWSWQQRIVSGYWIAAGSERDLPRACAVACIVAVSSQTATDKWGDGSMLCAAVDSFRVRPCGGFIWRELYVLNFQSSGSLGGGVEGGGESSA